MASHPATPTFLEEPEELKSRQAAGRQAASRFSPQFVPPPAAQALGFERFLEQRLASGGVLSNLGRAGRGARFTEGPFKGMTEAQAEEAARKQFGALSDAEKLPFEQDAQGLTIRSERERATAATNRAQELAAFGFGQQQITGAQPVEPSELPRIGEGTPVTGGQPTPTPQGTPAIPAQPAAPPTPTPDFTQGANLADRGRGTATPALGGAFTNATGQGASPLEQSRGNVSAARGSTAATPRDRALVSRIGANSGLISSTRSGRLPIGAATPIATQPGAGGIRTAAIPERFGGGTATGRPNRRKKPAATGRSATGQLLAFDR